MNLNNREFIVSTNTKEQWDTVIQKMCDDGYDFHTDEKFVEAGDEWWYNFKEKTMICILEREGFHITYCSYEWASEYYPYVEWLSAMEYLLLEPETYEKDETLETLEKERQFVDSILNPRETGN